MLFSDDNIQTTNCRKRKGKNEQKKILGSPTKTTYMIDIQSVVSVLSVDMANVVDCVKI